jgi:hypothetical protein
VITIRQLDIVYDTAADDEEAGFARMFDQHAARREAERRRDHEDGKQAAADVSPVTGGSW